MIQLNDFISYLDQKLEVSRTQDMCPNGLQVEGHQGPICSIATAVSANLETIEKAVKEGVQVLIVHHGIYWDRDPSPCIFGIRKEKIKLLLNHGISLLSYHLPLDCHNEFGNNWKAAKDLEWGDLKEFGPKSGELSVGVMGKFPPLSRSEFQTKLEKYYNHSATVALGGSETISSAALISGGAHREIKHAINAKVDAYITGSFDEPVWYTAYEEKINFFALGHSHTEKVGPKALGEHLAQMFNLQHQFIDSNNPF